MIFISLCGPEIKIIPKGSLRQTIAAISQSLNQISGAMFSEKSFPAMRMLNANLVKKVFVARIDSRGNGGKCGHRHPARDQGSAGHDQDGTGEKRTLIIHMYETALKSTPDSGGFNSSVKG